MSLCAKNGTTPVVQSEPATYTRSDVRHRAELVDSVTLYIVSIVTRNCPGILLAFAAPRARRSQPNPVLQQPARM